MRLHHACARQFLKLECGCRNSSSVVSIVVIVDNKHNCCVSVQCVEQSNNIVLGWVSYPMGRHVIPCC